MQLFSHARAAPIPRHLCFLKQNKCGQTFARLRTGQIGLFIKHELPNLISNANTRPAILVQEFQNHKHRIGVPGVVEPELVKLL